MLRGQIFGQVLGRTLSLFLPMGRNLSSGFLFGFDIYMSPRAITLLKMRHFFLKSAQTRDLKIQIYAY